jgi:hypothetical protein
MKYKITLSSELNKKHKPILPEVWITKEQVCELYENIMECKEETKGFYIYLEKGK